MSDGAPGDLTPSLVVRLRAGDSGAGRMLDAVYAEPLRRFAAGYVGESDARDIVQDAFVSVLAADAVPDDFRAFIYRVVRNRCLNALRARRRRRDGARLVTGFDVPVHATGVVTRLGRADDAARVAAAVASLSPAQREALALRYGDGLSRAEIAQVLGVAESVVKSRLYEGVRALERRLGASQPR